MQQFRQIQPGDWRWYDSTDDYLLYIVHLRDDTRYDVPRYVVRAWRNYVSQGVLRYFGTLDLALTETKSRLVTPDQFNTIEYLTLGEKLSYDPAKQTQDS